MKLVTATEIQIDAGEYIFAVNSAGAGTAALAISLPGAGGDSAVQQITDFSYTNENANGIVGLAGKITATLTGDATLYLHRLF